MPSGTKPLPEPMLTKICVAIWHHKATMSWGAVCIPFCGVGICIHMHYIVTSKVTSSFIPQPTKANNTCDHPPIFCSSLAFISTSLALRLLDSMCWWMKLPIVSHLKFMPSISKHYYQLIHCLEEPVEVAEWGLTHYTAIENIVSITKLQ